MERSSFLWVIIRTGSGSDRVDDDKALARYRRNPVATAPGSDVEVAPSFSFLPFTIYHSLFTADDSS